MKSPLTCEPPLLQRYTTVAFQRWIRGLALTSDTGRNIDALTAKSSGTPNLLFGVISASASMPPESSMRPFAILVGKKPGAMAVVKMCSGPSSTARFLVSEIAAALLAE